MHSHYTTQWKGLVKPVSFGNFLSLCMIHSETCKFPLLLESYEFISSLQKEMFQLGGNNDTALHPFLGSYICSAPSSTMFSEPWGGNDVNACFLFLTYGWVLGYCAK